MLQWIMSNCCLTEIEYIGLLNLFVLLVDIPFITTRRSHSTSVQLETLGTEVELSLKLCLAAGIGGGVLMHVTSCAVHGFVL